MTRKNQMPEWLHHILQEFSRPPYFLQEGLEKHKEAWEQGLSAPPQGEAPGSGTGLGFKSGLGDAFGSRPKQGFRPNPGAATTKTTPDGESPTSSEVRSSNQSRANSSKRTAPKASATNTSLSKTRPLPSSTERRPPAQGDKGLVNSRGANQRKRAVTEDADIVNAATEPNLQNDKSGEKTGPSTNWGIVFRKAGIPPEVVKQYNWTVKRAAWRDGAIRVFTPKATFALKNSYLSPARVEFLHQALLYVEEQGFTQFAPFVLTKDGRPCAVFKDKVYYASKWQTGQIVNFSSEDQVAKVAEVLARFHERSRGFESESYNPPMEFNIEGLLRRRTEDLKGLLARAEMRREKDRFDQVFTSIANDLREQAEQSVRLLDDAGLASFLQADEEVPGLCHLDVIPSNFIYTPGQKVVAIDFDLCTYAPRALDLSHLLRRALQKQNWRSGVAYQCFVAYNDVRPITGNEYALVQALLTFPYRAWRIANTRFRMGPAPGQLEEIEESVEEFGRRKDFLDSFARQISRDA